MVDLDTERPKKRLLKKSGLKREVVCKVTVDLEFTSKTDKVVDVFRDLPSCRHKEGYQMRGIVPVECSG